MISVAKRVSQAQSEDEILEAILEFSKIYPTPWKRDLNAILQGLSSQCITGSADPRLISGPLSIVEAILENVNTPMDVIFSYPFVEYFPEHVSHHPLIPLWVTSGSEKIFNSICVPYTPGRLIDQNTLKKSIHTNDGIEWVIKKFIELGAPSVIEDCPRIHKKNKRSVEFSEKDFLSWRKDMRRFYEEILSDSPEYLSYMKSSHDIFFHPAIPLERFMRLGQPTKKEHYQPSILVKMEEILNLMSLPYRPENSYETLGEVARKVDFFVSLPRCLAPK